jgi:hypothetical protein
MENISVKEYSKQFNISLQAVYQKIKRGQLKTVKDNNGNILILLEKEPLNNNVEILEKEIEYLKKQNEELKKDKEHLYKQLEQSNILQLKALETVKQLEHKTEVIEEQLIQEKSKKEIIEEELIQEKSRTIFDRIYKMFKK